MFFLDNMTSHGEFITGAPISVSGQEDKRIIRCGWMIHRHEIVLALLPHSNKYLSIASHLHQRHMSGQL